jgi:hypothetical protein
MALRRRSHGDDLPALELETWSEPAPAGVATERPGLGAGAWGALLIGLAALSGLVLAGRPHPEAEAEAAVAPAPRSEPATHAAPGVGVVAEPRQFVARTATLMPPGLARPALSSSELLASVGLASKSTQVELALGRYSEWMRGSQTIDHLVWVLVEKSAVTNRVRIFDAADGESLVEFASPPGIATCPIEIGASADHCASALAFPRRLVLSYLTSPHQY